MTRALNDLLKATSRPFYLTLPRAVRPQIGLAFSPLVFLPKAFNFQP
jgi:hypothetical protein